MRDMGKASIGPRCKLTNAPAVAIFSPGEMSHSTAMHALPRSDLGRACIAVECDISPGEKIATAGALVNLQRGPMLALPMSLMSSHVACLFSPNSQLVVAPS